MTDDEIMYRAFLTVYKVLGQTRSEISREERFIRAILATSQDKFDRAKRINPSKIAILRKKRHENIEN
jgi:hypothetical protein